MFIGISCTGDVFTIRDADGNAWTAGKFTYQQLVRKSQQGAHGSHIIDTEDDSLPTMRPDQLFTPISFNAELGVRTVSKPHLGDLDFVAKALRKKRGAFIVTIEVPNGPVLSSRSLADHEIVNRGQLEKKDRVRDSSAGLDIEIPGELAAPNNRFPVALFACIDTNRDGKCADELVDVMEDFNPEDQNNVVFFGALEAVVHGMADSRTIEFQRTSIDNVGSPEWIMQEVLKNLPSAPDQPPLSISLAVGSGWIDDVPEDTFQATGSEMTATELGKVQQVANQQKNRNKRTNGCFVKGTRIFLGSGSILRVEDVFIGTLVSTASGQTRRAERAVAGAERHETITIRTEGDRRIEVTQTHPMMTPSGLRMAKALKLGDLLVAADGSAVKITSLRRRRLADDDLVYNFALPGTADKDHLVNAEGLITGDLHLQQKLAAE
jgi:hypothetical protein